MPGPATGQPVTAPILKLFVSGRKATPMMRADGLRLLDIIGEDERERCTNGATAQAPLRMICSIEVSYGGEEPQPVGTGWLVGRRTVLTAGHVLWWDAGRPQLVRVIPGRDRDARPFGAFESSVFHFHPRWQGEAGQTPQSDIAAICLREALGDRIGWFGVSALSDPMLDGRNVNIAGYPAAVDGHQVQRCTELWHEANHISALDPDRIFYDVDTTAGQSGAPLLLWPDPTRSDAAPLAIGVHARGFDPGGSLNSATRINPTMLGLIGGWVATDNATG